ncbi:uncharacterized protein TNCV_4306931 [Trichonephila clavipes]|nr:uncharacterized protein TNCV_4306931 [Trichonephila clavipes]
MECHSKLVEPLGNNAIPFHTVARWVGKFEQGRVSTNDEQRSRRPVSVQKIGAPIVLSQNFTLLLDLIPKIKELIRGRRFATREDIANAVRQQVTQFTHDAANAEADGIQYLPHRWQRVVTVAGDYIEGL